MFNQSILRHATRTIRASRASPSNASFSRPSASVVAQRHLHMSAPMRKEDGDNLIDMEKGEHVGSYSRTDNTIQMKYPEEKDLPSGKPVQGRGGFHFKRTLASFSLEGNVGLVTGGARGLGLVMSQALVVSGADVAIVDLNSESGSAWSHTEGRY